MNLVNLFFLIYIEQKTFFEKIHKTFKQKYRFTTAALRRTRGAAKACQHGV